MRTSMRRTPGLSTSMVSRATPTVSVWRSRTIWARSSAIDVRDLAEVARVRLDGLAVALETHRAEAHVAEDLRRARDVVGRPELAIRLLDLLAFGILEERDAGREVRRASSLMPAGWLFVAGVPSRARR